MPKRRGGKKSKKVAKSNGEEVDSSNHADVSDTQLDEEETEEVVSKKRKSESSNDETDDEPADEPTKKSNVKRAGRPKKNSAKAPEKTRKSKVPLEASDEESDASAEYEVESILDEKRVKNKLLYLIRWKGFSKENDTWEPSNSLNCDQVIAAYKAKKKKKVQKEQEEDSADEERKEYEVDRILDVYFKGDGTREFLVLWKGYSKKDSTWEPEDSMDCPDLIKKFLDKVEKAKSVESRDLRVNRSPTQRFTLTTHDSGRRVGKRNLNKQRVLYTDCE